MPAILNAEGIRLSKVFTDRSTISKMLNSWPIFQQSAALRWVLRFCVESKRSGRYNFDAPRPVSRPSAALLGRVPDTILIRYRRRLRITGKKHNMRAFPKHVAAEPGYSFSCQFCDFDKFPFFWHFHPECELVFVIEGRGRRFVGDSIENFNEGDTVLLGRNIPHAWHSEPQGPEDRYRRRSVVIQFREEFLGSEFFECPEMVEIHELLSRAQRGIRFTGKTQQEAGRLMTEMKDVQGFERLNKLLCLLNLLAHSHGSRSLGDACFSASRSHVCAGAYGGCQSLHQRTILQAIESQ